MVERPWCCYAASTSLRKVERSMPDIVIIGGGLHGCSTAFHLLTREPGLKVTIVERDPTYDRAASARSDHKVCAV